MSKHFEDENENENENETLRYEDEIEDEDENETLRYENEIENGNENENNNEDEDMYNMYKDDPWGNKVPYMVGTKEAADMLMKKFRHVITRVVEVPNNMSSLIKM